MYEHVDNRSVSRVLQHEFIFKIIENCFHKSSFSSKIINTFFMLLFIPVINFNPRASNRRKSSLLMYPLSAKRNPVVSAVILGTTERSSTFPFVNCVY